MSNYTKKKNWKGLVSLNTIQAIQTNRIHRLMSKCLFVWFILSLQTSIKYMFVHECILSLLLILWRLQYAGCFLLVGLWEDTISEKKYWPINRSQKWPLENKKNPKEGETYSFDTKKIVKVENNTEQRAKKT